MCHNFINIARCDHKQFRALSNDKTLENGLSLISNKMEDLKFVKCSDHFNAINHD